MMYLSALAELGKSDELLAVLPDIPRHTQDVTQSKRRHMYRYLLRTVYLSGQTELLNHLIPSNWKVDSAHSMRLQCLSYRYVNISIVIAASPGSVTNVRVRSPAPNVEELLNAFQEASKVSNPSPKNYNAVLRGMVRSGAIDAALDKLSAFKKAGFLPNNETQEILLEAYVAVRNPMIFLSNRTGWVWKKRN
jgi:pentatricopeptide repeat protein